MGNADGCKRTELEAALRASDAALHEVESLIPGCADDSFTAIADDTSDDATSPTAMAWGAPKCRLALRS